MNQQQRMRIGAALAGATLTTALGLSLAPIGSPADPQAMGAAFQPRDDADFSHSQESLAWTEAAAIEERAITTPRAASRSAQRTEVAERLDSITPSAPATATAIPAAASLEPLAGEAVTDAAVPIAAVEPAPAPVPLTNRELGEQMAAERGWTGEQWTALEKLWTRESQWTTEAKNPSSGAYGIPQSLPGNKMAAAGDDWATNPATQITWGLDYIAERYGSPLSAWAHSQRVGWY